MDRMSELKKYRFSLAGPSKGKGEKKKKKKKVKKAEVAKHDEEEEDEEEEEGENALKKRAFAVLDELRQKFPQYTLNGHQNIWIVKPAGLSRGRGIRVMKQLVEIIDTTKSKEVQWVVQKYIENPLIVYNRKVSSR